MRIVDFYCWDIILSDVLLHLAYFSNKNVVILALIVQKMFEEYLKIFIKLISVHINSILQCFIDMNPYLLRNSP